MSLPADLKARLKASYDAIAPVYNARLGTVLDPVRLDFLSRLLALLSSSPPSQSKLSTSSPTPDPSDRPRPGPTATVLELGCGAGLPVSKALLEHTAPPITVLANDLSTTQLALARGHLGAYIESGALTLLPGDMLALEFVPASLDAVAAFCSIIHLPRDEQVTLMRKVSEWLRPGGYFGANFAAKESEAMVMEKWLGEEEGWTFSSGWGREGSVSMVREAGLEVLVDEVRGSTVDASFVWLVGRKAVVGESPNV